MIFFLMLFAVFKQLLIPWHIFFVVGCVKEAHSEGKFISIKAGWGSTVDA